MGGGKKLGGAERETINRMHYMRDESVFNKRGKIKKTQKYP